MKVQEQDLRTHFQHLKLNQVELLHDKRATKETEPLHKYIRCFDDDPNEQIIIEHNCMKSWNITVKYKKRQGRINLD